MNPWPSRPLPSSTRARCARISRSSSRRSTASRSPSSTRRRARRSRARCSTAMTTFYETSYANVHRGVYVLAERATEGLEHARETDARLPQRADAREMIFVRNATEAINLVAYAWGLWNLGPGDLVVVTELEHHSNFVPWQYIARQDGRRVPDAAARRARRARPLRPRRDRARRQRQGRRDEPRLELARDDQRRRAARRRGRTSRARSSSATRRRPRRT